MCVILFIHFSVVHYEVNSEKSQDWLYSGPNFGFYRKQFSSEFGKFRFVHCLYIWNHWRLLPDTQVKKTSIKNQNLGPYTILQQKSWFYVLSVVHQNSDGVKVGVMVSISTDYSIHIEMYFSKSCQFISIYNNF